MSNQDFNPSEEECHCEHCTISNEYTNIAMEAETREELAEIIRSLFEEAFEVGYKQATHDDIQTKVQILNDIDYGI